MWEADHSRKLIANKFGLTHRHIRDVIKTKHILLKKTKGQASIITSVQVDELESFVCLGFEYREMTFLEISKFSFYEWAVSEDVIRNARRRRGNSRKLAQVKPLISDRNKLMRKNWQKSICLGLKRIGNKFFGVTKTGLPMNGITDRG